MQWLPKAADFRANLKRAQSQDDPAERFEQLLELVKFRLGFVELLQLDRALGKAADAADQNLPRIRLALLSSCTVDQLMPAIRVAGFRHGLQIEIYCGPYGQFRQEVLDPASNLHAFDPDYVLFSLTSDDVVGQIPLSATREQVDAVLSTAVQDLATLWEQAGEALSAQVIQQNLLDVSEPLFGSHDQLISAAPGRMVAEFNQRVAEQSVANSVLLLDIARYSARDGIDAWFDPARWYQGKLQIAPNATPFYGDLVVRLISAQRGRSKKCLVLDLDNTLWGGIVGDDGVEGIQIGQGSPVGEAYLAVQRYVKSLSERGIVLTVCSKNEPDFALAPFQSHPDMLLQRSDFAVFIANWEDKAENIRQIAAELNLGLDSLVFVDDSPISRARVRDSLPMVAVPELPADAANYVRCLADAGYFEAISFTADDLARSGRYEANIRRKVLSQSAQSLDEFLRGLRMAVDYGPISASDLPRVTQLFNKTNQFNTTNRRFTGEELSSFTDDADNIALQFRISDRLGDNGLVSVITTRPVDECNGSYEIVNWVMSCRVFGRQLEDEVMNITVETARSKGIRTLRAKYKPTGKNRVISGLYKKLGFKQEADSEGAEGETYWHLSLSEYQQRPTFFTRADPS